MAICSPSRYKHIQHLLLGAMIGAGILSCSVLPPRRQYISEIKKQHIPVTLLNTTWDLVSFNQQIPDCSISFSFLEKGQLTIGFKGELYRGDNLWYLCKDSSTIAFHTRPVEKFVWTQDTCGMNPYRFAFYIQGDKKITFTNDKMSFKTFDDKEFIFKKRTGVDL
jgi:hypothetical protein